jgi:hypothetical protein
MGSIRQSLQAQPKNYRNTKSTNRNKKKSQIKVCLVLQKCKKAKIRMGAIRRRLQAQPKILNKLSEHQIYQSGRTFFQKNYV